MSKLHTNTSYSLGDIARRTAFSFFLFSLVLTSLLVLSWYLLVPELTHVEIGGTVHGLQDLREYRDGIHQDIISLEQQRGLFLVPVENDLYSALKGMKNSRLKFQTLRSDLRDIVYDIVPGQNNAIILSSFYYNAEGNLVELRGDVRNVGPRSMTVLAQFVERIHMLEEVIDVATSRYTRQEDADIGFVSPFTIRLTLR